LRRHGHVAKAYPQGGKDGVANGGSQTDQTGFARACRRQVLAVDEHDLNLRRVTEPGNAVLREVGVQNAAIGKEDSLEECAAHALNNGARKLIAQAVGIHNGAAIPRLNGAADAHFLASWIDLYFCAGSNVASLVHSAGNAKAALGR